MTAYFELVAATDQHRIKRPMSDLANIERDLDEIEARAADAVDAVATLNSDAIWENYRRNKGTPLAAHRLK